MRIGRLVFWISSLIICTSIIYWNHKQENAIPYEEKNPINVYCVEELQEDVKKMLEKSSLGETNRVVFINNKEDAEFVLTDEITSTDTDYTKIGWSPLIVAFDDTNEDTLKKYEEKGYILKNEEGGYDIDFEKVIEAVLLDEWTEKIYCPTLDTREGELFYQFLLINVNSGKYPENEQQIKQCIQKVKDFLGSDVVVKCDAMERLYKKRTVKNELYIIFEKGLEGIRNNDYHFEVSYPSNTVLYEYYYFCQGEHKNEIVEVIKSGWDRCKIEKIMLNYSIRHEKRKNAYSSYFKEQDGFSYVAIPLNSIKLEE